jgi:hypothetical protein
MKNMLALIGLVVVSFLGIGWYCEWYKVGAEPASNGQRRINVDLNTKEIAEDLTKVKAKVGEFVNNETKGTTPTLPVENRSDSQSPGVHVGPNGNPVIVLPKLEIRTGN